MVLKMKAFKITIYFCKSKLEGAESRVSACSLPFPQEKLWAPFLELQRIPNSKCSKQKLQDPCACENQIRGH